MTSVEAIVVLDLHIVAVDFSTEQFHPFFFFGLTNQINDRVCSCNNSGIKLEKRNNLLFATKKLRLWTSQKPQK